jgi:S-adenosylmethionine hydrolase
VAALLAAGREPGEFGPVIEEGGAGSRLVEINRLPQAITVDAILKGEIVSFDHFGNAATNINRSQLGAGKVIVSLPRSARVLELRQNFGQFPAGTAGCIINSQGNLEIVVNCGSAKNVLALEPAEPVHVTFG